MSQTFALLLPWCVQAESYLFEGKPAAAEAHLRHGLATVAALTGGAA